MASSIYDASRNKYKVKCGASLEEWEKSGWMREQVIYPTLVLQKLRISGNRITKNATFAYNLRIFPDNVQWSYIGRQITIYDTKISHKNGISLEI